MSYEPVHRTILAFDIESYGHRDRTDRIRVGLRKALDNLLREALAEVSISESDYQRADRGDGCLFLFAPEVSKLRLIDPFVPGLAARLEAYNRGARMEARMRLRMVLHAGDLILDEHGYAGEELNQAFRLLDSRALRRHLATTDAPLSLMVSQAIYDGIIKHRFGGLDPSSYQPVRVTNKGVREFRAWIWAPPHRTDGTDDDAWLVERIQRAFAHEEPTTEWSTVLARASTQREETPAIGDSDARDEARRRSTHLATVLISPTAEPHSSAASEEETMARAMTILRMADQMLEEARIQADAILREAQDYHREVTEVAQARARELTEALEARYKERIQSAEARARVAEEQSRMQIARLTEQVARRRQELESSIEDLRAFERDYRARLRGFVEGQLKALNDAAPSGPVAPPQPPDIPPLSTGARQVDSTSYLPLRRHSTTTDPSPGVSRDRTDRPQHQDD